MLGCDNLKSLIFICVLQALIDANEKFVVGLGGGGKHMDKKINVFVPGGCYNRPLLQKIITALTGHLKSSKAICANPATSNNSSMNCSTNSSTNSPKLPLQFL